MEKHLLKLRNRHDSFFCPESRFYLNYYNPQGYTEVITKAMKVALSGKTLIDVNGTVGKEEAPQKPVQESVKEEPKEETVEVNAEEGIDFETLTKAELLSFIEENGLDMKELGVTKNTSATKLRDAIWSHLEAEAK